MFEGDTLVHPSGQNGKIIFKPEREGIRAQWLVKYDNQGPESRLCLQIGDRGRALKRTDRGRPVTMDKAPWQDHEGKDRTMLDLMLRGCIFSIIKDRNGSFLITSESDTIFNAYITKSQLKDLANELLQLSES